jgi:hypothetical protein
MSDNFDKNKIVPIGVPQEIKEGTPENLEMAQLVNPISPTALSDF